MTMGTVSFAHYPLWVQVWGLLFDLFSKEVGQDIGMGLGRVVEVNCKGFTSNQASFLQIGVKIPLDKPLCRGSQIKSPKGNIVWAVSNMKGWLVFVFIVE